MKSLRFRFESLLLAALAAIPAVGQTVGENGFEFTIAWTGGTPVVVEASTNLAAPAWVPVSTNNPDAGSFYFCDPQWTNYSKRFYRTLSLDRSSWSSNLVGFVTLAIGPGYNLLANPLSTGLTNGANEILAPMDGAQFLTWNGAGFDTVAYSTALGGWIDLSNLNPANPPSLPPGKGFFFYNPQSTVSPMTFVGKVVPALCATNYLALPTGFSLIGSPLPAEVIDLLLPPVSLPLIYDMCVYEWEPFGGFYNWVTYSGLFGGWLRPGELVDLPPDNWPGKAFFFYNPGPATTWPQSLSCP